MDLELPSLNFHQMCWPVFSPQMMGGAGPSPGTTTSLSDRHYAEIIIIIIITIITWPTME